MKYDDNDIHMIIDGIRTSFHKHSKLHVKKKNYFFKLSNSFLQAAYLDAGLLGESYSTNRKTVLNGKRFLFAQSITKFAEIRKKHVIFRFNNVYKCNFCAKKANPEVQLEVFDSLNKLGKSVKKKKFQLNSCLCRFQTIF